MRKFIVLLLYCLFALPGIVKAQQQAEASCPSDQRFSMGFQLNQYQKDFGMGLNFTSPYYSNRIALRLRANLQYLEYIPANENAYTWNPYGNATLGAVVKHNVISNVLNVYSEGGAIALFPSGTFSNKKASLGGYGVLGVELMVGGLSYFFEMGGVGTGAQAEKASGKPIYSNGFIMSSGLHFYW